jgi:5-methylcytosine-specific restriction endonuclease McrA
MTTQTAFPTTTLVLTQSYVPHRIAAWQDVVTELFTGKVEILAEYDEVIYRSAEKNLVMLMPAVARLLRTTSAFKKGVKFSRVNVMSRDDFVCQYCGEKLPMGRLNYDHVVPRKLGGKTVWENIVTSCYTCNDKKGARTPEQAKMKLLRKPFRPRTLPLAHPVLAMRQIPKEWEPFVSAVA